MQLLITITVSLPSVPHPALGAIAARFAIKSLVIMEAMIAMDTFAQSAPDYELVIRNN